MSASDLRKLSVGINNVLKQTAGAKDIVRQAANAKTQGYIVNSKVILKEMLRPESPFLVELRGNKISASEMRKMARTISRDLYTELKKSSAKFKTFNVTGGKPLPLDFLNNGKAIVVGFDDVSRIVYYRAAKGGDHYRSFTEGLLKSAITRIKARDNALDPTRIFVSPDSKLLKAWNDIAAGMKAELAAQGVGGKGIEGRVGRAKKEFFKERNTPWGGLDAGHVFGAKVQGVAGLVENRTDINTAEEIKLLSTIPADLRPELEKVIIQIINLDSELRWIRTFKKNLVEGELTLLIPESTVNNKSTGGRAGQLAKDVLNPLLDLLVKELPNIGGSPSYNELIRQLIEDTFTGKKVTSKTYKTTIKNKKSAKVKIPIRGITAPGVKVSNTRSKEGGTPNLTGLINLINRKLHDKIRENMGKGASKQKLNYRTGRFAKSAKLENLIAGTEKNTIDAQMKYMRNPYEIFEKGNRLHKSLRDPAGIFGRSIRQILQEEKIANLRKVKVHFNG